ncbi:MAG: ATP-binding protein [Ignavibacteriaceae bacterium]
MKYLSLNRSYYKIRIIVTFCIVTIFLVLVFSFLSYRFVRKLYLDQLSDQVNIVTKMISYQIDSKYLELLQVGLPTSSTVNYFKNIFRENLNNGYHSQIFIFDKDFNIIVHSDSGITANDHDPLLLLNQNEISGLHKNESIVTLPFKGNDNEWYLWGFFRLDNNYWLALKENASRLERVEEFASDFFYLGLGGVILTILIAWFMARTLTKPIDQLVEFSHEIGQGNYNVRAPHNTHGEIKMLAQSMDKMKTDIDAHNKEKEKMLAQIAHEIRNPLGGIELLANLTKEDFVKESSSCSVSAEYLDKIICEINSLKSLITSYLNFSRPLPADPGWIETEKFLKEIEYNFRTNLLRRNIKFTFNNDDEKIWFDQAHLKQIFLNLMTNSLESIKQNGNISVSIYEKEKKWIISFSDDGSGIDEKNLSRIFEPFFTTKKNGTGLGLAICKKLCNENKAYLKVEKNSEKGLTFTIIKDIRV